MFRHGEDCKSLTIPTRCTTCGDSVYFFKCECGSRVFFDSLGHPWPIHRCFLNWGRSLRRSRDSTNSTLTVEINQNVKAVRKIETNQAASFFDLETTAITRTEELWGDISSHIQRRDPKSAEHIIEDLIGVIESIDRDVDVFKKLNQRRSQFNSAFLGCIGIGKWGRLTMLVPDGDCLGSYTAWIQSELTRGLSMKQCVCIRLCTQAILHQDHQWIVDEIQPIE